MFGVEELAEVIAEGDGAFGAPYGIRQIPDAVPERVETLAEAGREADLVAGRSKHVHGVGGGRVPEGRLHLCRQPVPKAVPVRVALEPRALQQLMGQGVAAEGDDSSGRLLSDRDRQHELPPRGTVKALCLRPRWGRGSGESAVWPCRRNLVEAPRTRIRENASLLLESGNSFQSTLPSLGVRIRPHPREAPCSIWASLDREVKVLLT
ncbi:hypothetical protein STTU_5149 [Streptomyces sp. Tu6071]|nr:hypothetical protein STTU_5149 [Streptomyces sp. Tu6071]